MKKIILVSMLASAFPASFSHALAPKNGDKPTYCEQIVSVHGLLTRAQFECGYSEYNNELISDSAKCFQYELGDEYGKEVLMFGMKEFDRNVKKDGKNRTCNNLLKEFPEYVRK
ncbi:hypothetical protein [Acinetobacter nosocomialis]|uniref:hypothetical protein n=1 Tax=Acinetobacter nosocomialis TaxID=106654 RepID=UPI00124DDCB8|nr:hypothetical protein [Acinetobacter nosocomialis]